MLPVSSALVVSMHVMVASQTCPLVVHVWIKESPSHLQLKGMQMAWAWVYRYWPVLDHDGLSTHDEKKQYYLFIYFVSLFVYLYLYLYLYLFLFIYLFIINIYGWDSKCTEWIEVTGPQAINTLDPYPDPNHTRQSDAYPLVHTFCSTWFG